MRRSAACHLHDAYAKPQITVEDGIAMHLQVEGRDTISLPLAVAAEGLQMHCDISSGLFFSPPVHDTLHSLAQAKDNIHLKHTGMNAAGPMPCMLVAHSNTRCTLASMM